MSSLPGPNSYSASVRMTLQIGEKSLPLSHVGQETIVLETATEIEASTAAEVRVWIDGELVSRPVCLKNGAVPYDELVEIEPRH